MSLEQRSIHPALGEMILTVAQWRHNIEDLVDTAADLTRQMHTAPHARVDILRRHPDLWHPQLILPAAGLNGRPPITIIRFAVGEELTSPLIHFTPLYEAVELDETKPTESDLLIARSITLFQYDYKRRKEEVIFDSGEEEERAWYTKIRKTTSFSEALPFIIEASGLSERDYATFIGIHRNQLRNLKDPKAKPSLHTVNAIIAQLPFDDMSKAAQMLRFRSQQKPPMRLDAVNGEPRGKLVEHARIAQGLSQDELGSILLRPQGTIWNIETRDRAPRGLDLDISRWLRDEPLEKVLQYRLAYPDEPVPRWLLYKLKKGRLLFTGAGIGEKDTT